MRAVLGAECDAGTEHTSGPNAHGARVADLAVTAYLRVVPNSDVVAVMAIEWGFDFHPLAKMSAGCIFGTHPVQGPRGLLEIGLDDLTDEFSLTGVGVMVGVHGDGFVELGYALLALAAL